MGSRRVNYQVGTLFWLFPQTPTDENSMPAEIIEVSSPVGSLGPGPSDDRMYVIFPVDKPREYGIRMSLPDPESHALGADLPRLRWALFTNPTNSMFDQQIHSCPPQNHPLVSDLSFLRPRQSTFSRALKGMRENAGLSMAKARVLLLRLELGLPRLRLAAVMAASEVNAKRRLV